MDTDPNVFIWYGVFVFSTVLHEASHALVAYKLGDSTAYLGGQVSLNPLPHMQREPWGMILIPLVTLYLIKFPIGFAHIPVDAYWARTYPKKSALVSLAGPLANLLIVIIAGLLICLFIHLGYLMPPKLCGPHRLVDSVGEGMWSVVATALTVFFSLNLLLFMFNMFPFPPMDGGSVLQLFIPKKHMLGYQNVIYNPAFSIVGLLVAWQLFEFVYSPLFKFSRDIIYPGMYGW